jgi:hypothetical protein
MPPRMDSTRIGIAVAAEASQAGTSSTGVHQAVRNVVVAVDASEVRL